MKKNDKRDSMNNLPIFNINIYNKINYNFEDNKKDFIIPKNRKDSWLEEELKKIDKLFVNEENLKIEKKTQKINLRSLSISLPNNPQLIFNNELYEEIEKIEKNEKNENEEINFNVELNSFVENENNKKKQNNVPIQKKKEENENLNIKINLKNFEKKKKNESKNNNIINKKIKKCNKLNNQLKLKEIDKIEIKLPKTRRYWHKDNYFLIPNIFKLLSPIEEEEEYYIEHHDYCSKEILVQTNGEKVRDYISIVKKKKLIK